MIIVLITIMIYVTKSNEVKIPFNFEFITKFDTTFNSSPNQGPFTGSITLTKSQINKDLYFTRSVVDQAENGANIVLPLPNKFKVGDTYTLWFEPTRLTTARFLILEDRSGSSFNETWNFALPRNSLTLVQLIVTTANSINQWKAFGTVQGS
jgi:hypothetical protein